MRSLHALCVFVVTVSVASGMLRAQQTPQELEQNRKKLMHWRGQPEKIQKLRKDAQTFFALPEEKREKFQKLDRELQAQSPAAQARLAEVLDRYTDWLEKQDEKTRKRIKETPDKAARLALIKELKDEEWMRTQPKAVRDQYAKLDAQAKTAFLSKLRQEDRQRRTEWQVAARFWKELENKVPLPAKLSDLPNDVQNYVNDYLRPMLPKADKERLDKAQGQWPQYPVTLVELADKHPPALPGPEGPREFSQLPQEVRVKLLKAKLVTPPFLKKAEGTWPGFGIAVSQLASKQKVVLPQELWPYSFRCLHVQTQDFVKKKLEPLLSPNQTLRLVRAEEAGKWPDYPQTIQELAREHNLTVPWHSLPGLRERWDNYRNLKISP
ncbi:MAG: hypothetical protein L0Y72_12280 [Gemmataceae bacterium]|nr:hypothetical protein [Gemmataceae bacterium]MCI0739815.1 hypothetical protein [Gemmataceae bacterium]